MAKTRKCACCGREVASGLVWDGTDTFCSAECAAEALCNDAGCVDILIDDGRIEVVDDFED